MIATAIYILDAIRRALDKAGRGLSMLADAFAEAQIGEAGHPRNDRRIGLRRWDDLEEVQIPRRIKEVRAEPVPAKVVAPAFREHGNRNA